MKYYVDAAAKGKGNGSKDAPFKKINDAAKIAQAGDIVIVSPGIYREAVDPKNAGTEKKRIVYKSLKDKAAVITGSQIINNWKLYKGNVYLCRIPNKKFGKFNPYTTLVSGDWFIATYKAHTGEVFLNGKSLYEKTSLKEVLEPKIYEKSWDPSFTLYTWYTEQDAENDETLIYANFQGADPNKECVEVTFRKNCFYPSKEGVGYITLSGFTIRQAASQWAPPTAYQEGMVGPHWSKGWIIEDCEISDAKCSGISLGKYFQKESDNKWLKWKFKDGTQTQRDCVCLAQIDGWSKEKIGSHIIRRCNIHDCGQTGIVGHLGGVFSVIENNHIHHINNKQNLAGAEIGGIKMHAAIDVQIRGNHIHHCTRGLWLDWQAQGTRVSKNLFHDNTLPFDANQKRECIDGLGEDIFIEVSHGPTLVDNNILLSDHALKLAAQGLAFVHNFIAGSLTCVGRGTDNGSLSKVSPRYTPYHVPHGTAILGFMTILHGDARFYNNIFVQKPKRKFMEELEQQTKLDKIASGWTDNNLTCGTFPYNDYPSEEEWKKQFEGYCGMGSAPSDRYYNPLPVQAEGNAYFNGALPMKKEKIVSAEKNAKVEWELKEESGKVFFKTNVLSFIKKGSCKNISTKTLGTAFESEQLFENSDGSPINFESDILGNNRESSPLPGPFAAKSKNNEGFEFTQF